MSARGLSCILLFAALATGCYTTRTVRAENLSPLEHQLDDGAVLWGSDGPPTRVDPQSLIRIRRKDGTQTRWFAARNLQTGEGGAIVRISRVPLEVMHDARVSGASAATLQLLDQTKPSTGEVEPNDDGSVTLHPGGVTLLEWVRRFEQARATANDPPLESERWSLRSDQAIGTLSFNGRDLQLIEEHGVLAVDGLRWDQIESIEVRNFDGFSTWLTVVTSPIWLTGVVTVAAFAGGVSTDLGAAVVDTAVVAARYPTGKANEEPLRDSEVQYGGVLWSPPSPPPSPEGAHPLFTHAALRRSRVRVIAWTGVGGELTSGQSSTLLFGAGVRLGDLWEIALGTDSWWADPFGYGDRLPGFPLAPGPPRYVPHLIGFVHVGGDFAVEAWRRVSLPLAIEAGLGTDPAFQLRLQFGARVRIIGGVFVGLHPFNPQYTSVPVGGTTRWTFPSFVELGNTF